jgi:metal-sulfur cluster biosynthetic enzyme
MAYAIMADPDATIKSQVVTALHTVVDPCGLFNGSRITIGELGMYRNIVVTDEVLEIELFLDDPSCAFAGQIMLDLRQAVGAVAGGREIRMPIVYDEVWDVDRISAAGQCKLLRARTALRQSLARQNTP